MRGKGLQIIGYSFDHVWLFLITLYSDSSIFKFLLSQKLMRSL
ncbi:hypothetical protein PRJBM_01491 [Bartonella henselae]|nr:hypothetical protein Q654_01510 [Bartonella henselae JK 50]ETS05985.1 hypothetical protein Q655_01456 [Bartonella henselae JK 51]KEC58844.1 hypothetical protein O97_00143 [Bartonella henselae str. Zeus]KEC60924.1 hypothetical protein O95_00319 [Bartonella henselae JK 53]CDO40836.1 hypothetical protein PRJBM_01491 [Bartonella henselae]